MYGKVKEKVYKNLAILVIFFVSLIFFFPIFKGKTFFAFDILIEYLPWSSFFSGTKCHNSLISDPINFFYPLYHFYQNSIKTGFIPFWNNLIFCGVKFIPFSTYPYIYYSIFPILFAHDFLLFVHLFFTGFFTYLYLRTIGLKKLSSLIGAISWMFNGYIMVWFEFEYTLMMATTLPGIFYFIEKWWLKRSKTSFLGLIFIISFSLSIGYAHLIIFQLLVISFYVIYKQLKSIRKNKKFIKKPIIGIIVAFIISFIISTNFFTAHLSMSEDSQRKEISPTELFKEKGQLPPQYLITLLYPDFFGSPTEKFCFTPRSKKPQCYNNYNELCIYSGIITIFFVVLSLLFYNKRKHTEFFLALSILTLLMAMGSILYYPFLRFVPGLSFSAPTRILYIFGFSVSILAAIGSDILYVENIKNKRFPVFVWTLIIILAAVVFMIMQTDRGIKFIIEKNGWGDNIELFKSLIEYYSLFSTVFLKSLLILFTAYILSLGLLCSTTHNQRKSFVILAIILLSYDLISFGLSYNTVLSKKWEFPATRAIKFLKNDNSKFRIVTFGNFLQNSFMPFFIEDIGGYSSFYPKQYAEYIHLSQYGNNIPLPEEFGRWMYLNNFGSPLFDIINTKYLLFPPDADVKHEKLDLVYNKEIKIYKNRDYFERAFFVPSFEVVENDEELREKLISYSYDDFKKKVLIEKRPSENFLNSDDKSSKNTESNIEIIEYSPNKVVIKSDVNKSGFVVLGDNYHPGWMVSIDGKKASLYRGNYIMRAVPVNTGRHKIVMEFKPKIIITGLLISLCGWTILIIVTLYYLISKKMFNKSGS